jgi:hypothetical protein
VRQRPSERTMVARPGTRQTHLVPSASRTWMLVVGCVVLTSKRGLMLAPLLAGTGAALATLVLGALVNTPNRFPVPENTSRMRRASRLGQPADKRRASGGISS